MKCGFPLVDVVLLRELAQARRKTRAMRSADSPCMPLARMTVSAKTGFSTPIAGVAVPRFAHAALAEHTSARSNRMCLGAALGVQRRDRIRRVPGSRSRCVRIFALVTDAYGGRGGIAQYNRDFLSALVRAPTVREVVVLPRQVPSFRDGLPAGICQSGPAASRIVYSGKALRNLVQDGPFDVIFCGHILMTPLAALLARSHGAPLVGAGAWN